MADLIIPEEMVEKAAAAMAFLDGFNWDKLTTRQRRMRYLGQAKHILSAALAGRQVVDAPDDGHCSKCGQPFSPDVRAAIVDEPVEDLPDITVQHPTRGLIRWSWREVRWVQVAAGSGSGED